MAASAENLHYSNSVLHLIRSCYCFHGHSTKAPPLRIKKSVAMIGPQTTLLGVCDGCCSIRSCNERQNWGPQSLLWGYSSQSRAKPPSRLSAANAHFEWLKHVPVQWKSTANGDSLRFVKGECRWKLYHWCRQRPEPTEHQDSLLAQERDRNSWMTYQTHLFGYELEDDVNHPVDKEFPGIWLVPSHKVDNYREHRTEKNLQWPRTASFCYVIGC